MATFQIGRFIITELNGEALKEIGLTDEQIKEILVTNTQYGLSVGVSKDDPNPKFFVDICKENTLAKLAHSNILNKQELAAFLNAINFNPSN